MFQFSTSQLEALSAEITTRENSPTTRIVERSF